MVDYDKAKEQELRKQLEALKEAKKEAKEEERKAREKVRADTELAYAQLSKKYPAQDIRRIGRRLVSLAEENLAENLQRRSK